MELTRLDAGASCAKSGQTAICDETLMGFQETPQALIPGERLISLAMNDAAVRFSAPTAVCLSLMHGLKLDLTAITPQPLNLNSTVGSGNGSWSWNIPAYSITVLQFEL